MNGLLPNLRVTTPPPLIMMSNHPSVRVRVKPAPDVEDSGETRTPLNPSPAGVNTRPRTTDTRLRNSRSTNILLGFMLFFSILPWIKILQFGKFLQGPRKYQELVAFKEGCKGRHNSGGLLQDGDGVGNGGTVLAASALLAPATLRVLAINEAI